MVERQQIRILSILIIAAITFLAFVTPVYAQSPVESQAKAKKDTSRRILSKDGIWSIPVASNVLGSDTWMHQKPGRNSEMTHGAFDISAPVGSPVYGPCAEEGEVVHASKANEGGYGYNIRVKCSNGLEIWIGHLQKIWTKKGSKVAAHTQIGTVGRTGMTSFNHIHITLRNYGRHDGISTDIESHFDLSLFHWDPFSSPGNEPWEWDGYYTNAADPLDHYFPTDQGGTTSQQSLVLSLIIYIALTAIIHALSRDHYPIRRRFMLLASAHTLLIGFLFYGAITLPVTQPPEAQASTGEPTVHSDDFERIIGFMLDWEGWKCTHDPVRTMGGITNVTYQAWLKKQGRTYADVCKSLTKDERKSILKAMYWDPIAADEAWPLNAAIFDAQIGSGQGMAARLLRSNKTFKEYQNARKVYYRSMNRPASYISAWLRRVDELNELVERTK